MYIYTSPRENGRLLLPIATAYTVHMYAMGEGRVGTDDPCCVPVGTEYEVNSTGHCTFVMIISVAALHSRPTWCIRLHMTAEATKYHRGQQGGEDFTVLRNYNNLWCTLRDITCTKYVLATLTFFLFRSIFTHDDGKKVVGPHGLRMRRGNDKRTATDAPQSTQPQT